MKMKAIYLFHNWFNTHSFLRYEKKDVALACIYLVAKVDEELTVDEKSLGRRSFGRLLRSIVLASRDVTQGLLQEYHIQQGRVPTSSFFKKYDNKDPYKESQTFRGERDRVVMLEPALLFTIAFNLRIDIPIVPFLKVCTIEYL